MNKHMCFKKNGKPRGGVPHRYGNCQMKSRFRAVRDAIQAADRFVDRVLLGSAPVVPYYCPAGGSSNLNVSDRPRISSQSLSREIQTDSYVLAKILSILQS